MCLCVSHNNIILKDQGHLFIVSHHLDLYHYFFLLGFVCLSVFVKKRGDDAGASLKSYQESCDSLLTSLVKPNLMA